MPTLYPSGYDRDMITFAKLEAKHKPHMHPEAWRRMSNFVLCMEGKFGVGGGYRPPGHQPDGPTFAPQGHSFHQDQEFPSGTFYIAWDMVVLNLPGDHRAPRWDEVPKQGSKEAADYGVHFNVGEPGSKGNEPWHMQPIFIDGWQAWANDGKPDIEYNYPIKIIFQQEEEMAPRLIQPTSDKSLKEAKNALVLLDFGNGHCIRVSDGNRVQNHIKSQFIAKLSGPNVNPANGALLIYAPVNPIDEADRLSSELLDLVLDGPGPDNSWYAGAPANQPDRTTLAHFRRHDPNA